ncbi:hypothetical protein [Polaribacter sp. Z022]|uniref:hypothetical protein n=1 Tax=Polaribacter sp. Z022 TaxID=2927125 RepID=UPI0020220CB6|nr:hypothetical protein [Polaribacter sp. Z022]MCL7754169.1 hypothetical protein [Polaribacter sp. Z022]
MNQEEKNKRNRKKADLTTSEKLSFFFMPFNLGTRLSPTKDFNDTEIERFEKYGFEQKLIDARKFKYYGFAFYIFLFLIFLLSTS